MTNQPSLQAQVNEVAQFATWLAGAFLLLWVGRTIGGAEKKFVNEMLDIATPKEIPVRIPQVLIEGGDLIPQAQPEMSHRDQAHHAIEDIQKAIDETRKADSIRRIERAIDRIDTEILDREIITGMDDLQGAIEDYKGIERAGFTPEEYQEEKEAAFEAIEDAAQGLDIDEEALEDLAAPPEPLPVVDMEQLKRKYGWWAARLAEAVCPHNDIACIEREARRLIEARAARL